MVSGTELETGANNNNGTNGNGGNGGNGGAGGTYTNPGPQQTQERPITGVAAVELRTSGNLNISKGDRGRLTITAGSNDLTHLTSDVTGNTLVLSTTPGFSVSGPIHYELVMPRLDALVVSGSGDVRGAGLVSGPFKLDVTGSGGTDLTGLAAGDVVVTSSGSGDIHLSGQATAQHVTVRGSGKYDTHDLVTQQAVVKLSGSGTALVNVVGQLAATDTGSGDITYTGSPQVSQRVSGSGTISKG